MLRDLCHEKDKGTIIYCSNNSTIAFSKNYVFHKITKHIDAKYHFIRELVNNGEIVLHHCRTKEQFADILTKPSGQRSFVYFRQCMEMTHGNSCD